MVAVSGVTQLRVPPLELAPPPEDEPDAAPEDEDAAPEEDPEVDPDELDEDPPPEHAARAREQHTADSHVLGVIMGISIGGVS